MKSVDNSASASVRAEIRMLSRKKAAEYLNEIGWKGSVKTLEQLAWRGGGPRYAIIGHSAMYRITDLNAWIEDHFTTSARENSSRD